MKPLDHKELPDPDYPYPDNAFEKDVKIAEYVVSFIVIGIAILLILAGVS